MERYRPQEFFRFQDVDPKNKVIVLANNPVDIQTLLADPNYMPVEKKTIDK